MKIHFLDRDDRQFTDPVNYPVNHGPFSEVAIQMNEALKSLGSYAEPDDADWVGICDGLQVNFNYKNKRTFVVSVWETLNSLPLFLLNSAQNQTIFGLSDQITNLWKKYGVTCKTVYPGCDTDFWKPTVPKSDVFTFLHVNSSNVRSGLDLSIDAYTKAFGSRKDVRLVIKDTNNSPLLLENINRLKSQGVNIEYHSYRASYYDIRGLYSSSHVCLNLIRSTSFGLPLLECSACRCLCVTGDIPPTNEIIKPDFGVLIPMKEPVPINQMIGFLVNRWGLTNCYPAFPYPEEPLFADYDVDKYAGTLLNIYNNWSFYGNIDTRTPIVNNWRWDTQAKKLVEYLREL